MVLLPSSADVPVVSPRRSSDPGLNVPAGAFTSPLTSAATEIAPALQQEGERLAKAEQRLQNREDVVAESDQVINHAAKSEAEGFRVNKEQDLSNPETLRKYQEKLRSFTLEGLDSHTGSADSLARLTAKLQSAEAGFSGAAIAQARTAGKNKVDQVYDSQINSLTKSISVNPSLDNVFLQMSNADGVIADLAAGYDPAEEAQKKQEGRSLVALAAIDSLIFSGRVEQADAYMNSDIILNALSSTDQREVRNRITKVLSSRKDIAHEAALAGAVEAAKLTARRENINQILASVGAFQLSEDGQEPLSVTSPFGDGVESSADAQDAARLFAASRKLLAAGETAMGNGMLSQARFIIENSPEMQRDKELDKPISADLASEFGVPVGTTLRSVMSLIPPSPEESAESTAAASAKGRERIKGEEQISFIDDASIMVTDLLEEVALDPTLVGVGGSLRSTGQTALGVIGDLGATALVDGVKNMAFENTDLGLDNITDLFDSPTLSVLSIMENSIGLILARLRTPSGRIPVDVIKRSINDVGLTGLKSSVQVQNRLNFILDQLNRRSGAIEQRFGLPSNADDDVPDFKVIDGKLVRVGGQ